MTRSPRGPVRSRSASARRTPTSTRATTSLADDDVVEGPRPAPHRSPARSPAAEGGGGSGRRAPGKVGPARSGGRQTSGNAAPGKVGANGSANGSGNGSAQGSAKNGGKGGGNGAGGKNGQLASSGQGKRPKNKKKE